jgi:NAD(P)-dependent dehydrogenase (short-subunit alcohol dehydrogenase family)
VKIDLTDRVVLVTGASKGIGRAIVLGAAQAGAAVAVNYCTGEEEPQALVKQIRELSERSIAVPADIADVAQVQTMVRVVRDHFGRLDVLINNAGITVRTELFETTEQDWDRCLGVNLKGTFFTSLEAARIMRGQRRGSIVNVSTNCAALGVKNLAVYTASKGGIHSLTKQLAVELAPYRIRVNTFAPGPTRVERNLNEDPHYDRTWGCLVPMQRIASPQEMVGPALFLASDQSSYMTGQVFYVDGGWSVSGKTPGDVPPQGLSQGEC